MERENDDEKLLYHERELTGKDWDSRGANGT
jgi:hypothetical protein